MPKVSATEKKLLTDLNEDQKLAVLHKGGPLLVLAGAGSGKTRVITYRIAHLVECRKIAPREIVAVTFTNKAADEMKVRVRSLIKRSSLHDMWVGTFHAFCLRILRKEASLLGYKDNFLVYDTLDQLALIREGIEELRLKTNNISPREALSKIGNIKNRLITPEKFLKNRHDRASRTLGKIYAYYQDKLFQNNSMDFDDMIMKTLQLFSKHPKVKKHYASKCRHLLVDEYQDTNHSQYLLIKNLSSVHHNLSCVGDEDQSIYAFRGADINNILRFQSDFRKAKIIKLEKNYRSTQKILLAASQVVFNNKKRIGKDLWTDNEKGDNISVFHATDDMEEADFISTKIIELKRSFPLDSIAVLYRTNAQSRLLEESLRQTRIPYQLVGSLRFYERKEIKDLIAYLKIIVNPDDDLSLLRILNTPARGLGKVTVEKLLKHSDKNRNSVMDSIRSFIEEKRLSKKGRDSLEFFLSTVQTLKQASGKTKISSLIKKLIKEIEFKNYLKKNFPNDYTSRLENIDSLISAAVEYQESTEHPSLQGFVDRSSLRSDQDDLKNEKLVSLMTVHCAKGLEYPVVFIAGMEENLFPHIRSKESQEDIEEERRLFYVAMTRAQKKLFISCSDARRMGGELIRNLPSPFLDEIPNNLLTICRGDYRREKDSLDVEDQEYRWEPLRSSAALANKNQKTPIPSRKKAKSSSDSPFTNGQAVHHAKFGRGTVLESEGSGENLKLTIRFKEGVKRILLKYAPLVAIKTKHLHNKRKM